MKSKLVTRLLYKNISAGQLIGFILSNIAGLTIMIVALQLYADVRPITQGEDSFLRRDYLVVNKIVTSAGTLGMSEDKSEGMSGTSFSPAEIADLERQPWVRKVDAFTTSDFKVTMTAGNPAGRGLSTMLFFESLPDSYIDAPRTQWFYNPGDTLVPIILSKEYLALYNFGFAGASGMPQVSEGLVGAVPVALRLQSEDGTRSATFRGRIVGFSNRLNTILVPRGFMDYANKAFGTGMRHDPSRLIVDVSSPGDTAIAEYLQAHHMESAGDKSASQASFFLNVTAGAVAGVGLLIILLSFFILFLSIQLLMQKNRGKLHSLVMLGYPLGTIAAPYRRMTAMVCLVSLLLSAAFMLCLRAYYIRYISQMGGGGCGVWLSLGAGVAVTLLVVLFNMLSINRRVRECA